MTNGLSCSHSSENVRKKNKISILSLGCSKNLVDSERLAHRFNASGFETEFVDDVPTDGSTLIINTCGFIGDAKEESIENILQALQNKEQGTLKAVYLMGCLTERYRADLKEEFSDADGLYGKFDWEQILGDISAKEDKESRPWERTLSTAPHYTYVKVSEGCDRFCAFCAIPLITGRHHSRPVEEILEEVSELAAKGTREFNIIAQDLSSYGKDFPGGKSRLAELIDRMAQIPGVDMIRLHYAYPSDFPYDILPVMARHQNVCKYLDIALQHSDDRVLGNMRRHITAEETRRLLERIRREVPGIHIRTTMMVGFPGETEDAFENLLDFVREQRFERLGAFAYCEEDDTYAAKHYSDVIPQVEKDRRVERLMAVQEEIAARTAAEKVGCTLRVIIDEAHPDHYIGRTEFDSPEVDCVVIVNSEIPLETGHIYPVEITASDGFDLVGKYTKQN